MMDRMKAWADAVRRDVVAIYLAARDPRVPRGVKILALLVAAYALSPIDLIPDFIPVLGYLDDLILLPLAMLLVRRLIPPPLLAELRAEAATRLAGSLPYSRAAAIAIVLIWTVAALAVGWWGVEAFRSH